LLGLSKIEFYLWIKHLARKKNYGV